MLVIILHGTATSGCVESKYEFEHSTEEGAKIAEEVTEFLNLDRLNSIMQTERTLQMVHGWPKYVEDSYKDQTVSIKVGDSRPFPGF